MEMEKQKLANEFATDLYQIVRTRVLELEKIYGVKNGDQFKIPQRAILILLLNCIYNWSVEGAEESNVEYCIMELNDLMKALSRMKENE